MDLRAALFSDNVSTGCALINQIQILKISKLLTYLSVRLEYDDGLFIANIFISYIASSGLLI